GLEERKQKIVTDEKERIYKIGRATIKEIRGGTEEQPEGLGTQAVKLLFELVPEFSENHPRTGQGIFKDVYEIDIKSCYANIMRDYPLPCGKSEQIPFLPDYDGEIKESAKELKKTDEKRGKILANALYGYLGKSSFGGYHYHPFMGELPAKFLKEAEKYQKYKIIHYQQVGFFGDDNVFVYDNRELKSFANNPSERKKLMEEFLKQFRKRDKNKQKQPAEYQLINSLPQIKRDNPFLKETHSSNLQETTKRPIHRYNSFVYSQPIEKVGCGYKIDNSPISKRTENRKLKLTLGQQNHHNIYLEINLRMERNFEGKAKTLAIERKNGRYYALFSCEEVKQKLLPKTNIKVGLDLGIRNLIITSDSKKIQNPKFYKKSEKLVKEAQKKLSKKVKEANKIVKAYDSIAVENLNVKSMLEKKLGDNKKSLRRSLASVKFGILLKVISDKVEETGRRLVLVDPKNTTQTCSSCGELANPKLTLRDKMFEC
ncbi:6974_t:CDS:2, partial [Cetraspora pellucida]